MTPDELTTIGITAAENYDFDTAEYIARMPQEQMMAGASLRTELDTTEWIAAVKLREAIQEAKKKQRTPRQA